MQILKSDSIQQFGFGFKVLLPFEDSRDDHTAPVNGGSDTWEVVIIRPDGSSLVKTSNLEFPDSAVPAIAVPLTALDLELRGTYSYQVFKTTGSVKIPSDVETFEVKPSLIPTEYPVPLTSPYSGYFPIYDDQGRVVQSTLHLVSGVLYLGGSPVVGGATAKSTGEVPAGAVNGVNATFTTAFNFIPESVELFVGGIRLKIVDDYTTSGRNSISLLVSPLAGEKILVNYDKDLNP